MHAITVNLKSESFLVIKILYAIELRLIIKMFRISEF